MSTEVVKTSLPGVGIFGTGKIVYSLVPMLRKDGFTIKGIWGRTPEESSAAARNLSIPFATSRIDEIVLHKEVDVIFVMCPPQYQSQITIKALGIGKHVVCNTPGGLHQVDVLKMVSAGNYYPTLITLMNYGLRLLPVFAVTKQLIQGGFCGTLQLCEARVESGPIHSPTYDWTCDAAMGGGILPGLGAHLIDAILFLTDRDCHSVSGILKSLDKSILGGFRQITSESFCSFQMELLGDVCVNASLSVRSMVKADFNMELFVSGTKGALYIRGSDLYGKKWDADEEELLFSDRTSIDDVPAAVPPPVQRSLSTANQTPAVADDIAPPRALMLGSRKLVECLKAAFLAASDGSRWDKNSVAGAATFHDGQRVVAVIEAIRRSNATKQWTSVHYLSDRDEPDRTSMDGSLSAPYFSSL